MTLGKLRVRCKRRREELPQFRAQVGAAALIDRLLADLDEISGGRAIALIPPPAPGTEPMLAASDAAAYMGLAPQTLAKMRLYGDSPPFYKLGRRVLYKRGELDSWIAARRRRSTSDTGVGHDHQRQ